jgi:hypothetical protein
MTSDVVFMDKIQESNVNNFKLSKMLHGSQYGHKDFIYKDDFSNEFFKRETKKNDAKMIKQFSDENHEVRSILERDKCKKLRSLGLE